MLDGIERQASGVLRRVIAQPIGNQTVAELMESDTDQRGNQTQKNL